MFGNRPISICQNSVSNSRPQYEARGNKYRVCGVYSPEPRYEVYCLRLNCNIGLLLSGLNIFNPCVKFQQDVCKFAKDNVDGSNVMSLFYASGISNSLGNCKVCFTK